MVKDIRPLPKTKVFVINLERNKKRLQQFNEQYYDSDIRSVPLERFEAINGREIDIRTFLTEAAYKQILFTESSGYRLKHYELTRGAVGCFLSHMTLYYRLLDDPKNDSYIIFEDDAIFSQDILEQIKLFMSLLPKNFDLLVLGTIHQDVIRTQNLFTKLNVFWGLYGYIINKRGASKIVREYENNKIEKQIDSTLSVMTTNNRLNVYGLIRPVVFQDTSFGTDIQIVVKPTVGIDAFVLEDFSVKAFVEEFTL